MTPCKKKNAHTASSTVSGRALCAPSLCVRLRALVRLPFFFMLLRALEMASRALLAYRLRSMFVIAAMALGIASLTIIGASISGAGQKMDEILEMFGPDAAMLLGGAPFQKAVGARSMSLTPRDLQAIQDNLTAVSLVAPMRSRADLRIRYEGRTLEVPVVVGSGAQYAKAWNWPLAQGRDISEEDVAQGRRVILLGDKPSRDFFGDESPLGKTVYVDSMPMTVIGVPVARGGSSPGGSMDDRVIMPISTLTQRFNLDRRHFFVFRLKFTDAENLDAHTEDLRLLLRQLHRLEGDQKDDFTIISASEIQRISASIRLGMVLFLGTAGVVAVLVGGFVLANLFHLSVSERRMEIGLKKAMGASARAILCQFLCEALVLTLLGSLLGLILGKLLGLLVESFGILPMIISPTVFLCAVGISLVIGLVFGLKPARVAARLDPIRALRGGE